MMQKRIQDTGYRNMIQSTEYRILNTGLWNITRDAEHLIHDGWIRIQDTET